MTSATDPRLGLAVNASRAWYDDVFALHGREVRISDGLWWSPGTPPPWHSSAKTLRPGVPSSAVVDVAGQQGSVADSFHDLELDQHGFAVLFTASWIHLDPPGPSPAPPDWSAVTTPALLAEWSIAHDYVGVLTDAVLRSPRFRVFARHEAGELTGGAIAHDAGGATGLSNVWSLTPDGIDWPTVVDLVGSAFPDRPVVTYERGAALAGAVRAGFREVGEHRVWLR